MSEDTHKNQTSESPKENPAPKNPPIEHIPPQVVDSPPKEHSIKKVEPISTKTEPQEEIAEVHHHPHLPHKKKWNHYLFEFFMLFLAVTAGFFVENLREHYIESQQAHEYAQSLYDDLRADTSFIERTYNEKIWIEAKYDSLKQSLLQPSLFQSNELLYYVVKYLSYNDVFTPQDVTFDNYMVLVTSDILKI